MSNVVVVLNVVVVATNVSYVVVVDLEVPITVSNVVVVS